MSTEMNRRTFVKNSAIAATTLATMTSNVVGANVLGANILGANDRLNVGVIGCGRMGRHNLDIQKG